MIKIGDPNQTAIMNENIKMPIWARDYSTTGTSSNFVEMVL